MNAMEMEGERMKTCEDCPHLYVDYYYDNEKEDECPVCICELDTDVHIDTDTVLVPSDCPLLVNEVK